MGKIEERCGDLQTLDGKPFLSLITNKSVCMPIVTSHSQLPDGYNTLWYVNVIYIQPVATVSQSILVLSFKYLGIKNVKNKMRSLNTLFYKNHFLNKIVTRQVYLASCDSV